MFYIKKYAKNYFDELKKEVLEKYDGEKIRTIYVGGGTPSCLNINELKKLKEIIDIFDLSDNYEFTFECNLNDLNDMYLNHLKELKVNRLSIGIESFDQEKLKLMGREASFDYANKIIKIARLKGFDNINIDMIYGTPRENINTLKNDVKKVLKLNPDHISFYSLILEPNTKLSIFYDKTIDEDLDYTMYKYINKTLTKKGYNHYEISNYAKINKESIHNLTYWKNEEYYGFGLGACGYKEQVRYENTRSITAYLNGKHEKTKDLLSIEDMKKNELMLGLRLFKGIDINTYRDKYNEDLLNNLEIKKLIKNKSLILNNNHLCINPKKMYVMNEILLKLL